MKKTAALQVILLFFCIGALAQKQYRGTYSCVEKIPLDGLVAQLDSGTNDPMLKLLGKSAKVKLLESALGNTIEQRISFIADDTSAMVSMKVTKHSPQIRLSREEMKQYLRRNKWYQYRTKSNAFEGSSDIKPLAYKFTGRKKKILGYVCHEAVGQDEKNKEHVLWICRNLPYTITPWPLTDKRMGAVLQFSDGVRMVKLTSLKQSSRKQRIKPLQKIKE
jgi:GLPGLI family protein